jgi:hypothetical protein
MNSTINNNLKNFVDSTFIWKTTLRHFSLKRPLIKWKILNLLWYCRHCLHCKQRHTRQRREIFLRACLRAGMCIARMLHTFYIPCYTGLNTLRETRCLAIFLIPKGNFRSHRKKESKFSSSACIWHKTLELAWHFQYQIYKNCFLAISVRIYI